MLLEGTHLLQEVLRQGNAPEEIIATEAWLQGHSALAARCSQARWVVPEVLLRERTGAVPPVRHQVAARLLPRRGSGKLDHFCMSAKKFLAPGSSEDPQISSQHFK